MALLDINAEKGVKGPMDKHILVSLAGRRKRRERTIGLSLTT